MEPLNSKVVVLGLLEIVVKKEQEIVSEFEEKVRNHSQEGEDSDLEKFTNLDFVLVLNQFGLAHLLGTLAKLDPPVNSLKSFSDLGLTEMRENLNLSLCDTAQLLLCLEMIQRGMFRIEDHKDECSIC